MDPLKRYSLGTLLGSKSTKNVCELTIVVDNAHRPTESLVDKALHSQYLYDESVACCMIVMDDAYDDDDVDFDDEDFDIFSQEGEEGFDSELDEDEDEEGYFYESEDDDYDAYKEEPQERERSWSNRSNRSSRPSHRSNNSSSSRRSSSNFNSSLNSFGSCSSGSSRARRSSHASPHTNSSKAKSNTRQLPKTMSPPSPKSLDEYDRQYFRKQISRQARNSSHIARRWEADGSTSNSNRMGRTGHHQFSNTAVNRNNPKLMMMAVPPPPPPSSPPTHSWAAAAAAATTARAPTHKMESRKPSAIASPANDGSISNRMSFTITPRKRSNITATTANQTLSSALLSRHMHNEQYHDDHDEDGLVVVVAANSSSVEVHTPDSFRSEPLHVPDLIDEVLNTVGDCGIDDDDDYDHRHHHYARDTSVDAHVSYDHRDLPPSVPLSSHRRASAPTCSTRTGNGNGAAAATTTMMMIPKSILKTSPQRHSINVGPYESCSSFANASFSSFAITSFPSPKREPSRKELRLQQQCRNLNLVF